jgi:hypothetical protein
MPRKLLKERISWRRISLKFLVWGLSIMKIAHMRCVLLRTRRVVVLFDPECSQGLLHRNFIFKSRGIRLWKHTWPLREALAQDYSTQLPHWLFLLCPGSGRFESIIRFWRCQVLVQREYWYVQLYIKVCGK